MTLVETFGIGGSFRLPKLTFQIRGSNQPIPDQRSMSVSTHSVEVNAGTSVLAAAYSCGVLIPTICGGFAKCRACIVKIPSGSTKTITPAVVDELRMLRKEDAARGFRLACQARVLADVLVEIDFSTLEPEA